MKIVAEMRHSGVPLLAGTDTLNPFCFPGFSLHDELALLVTAGLSPMEALQAATRSAATYLGTLDSYGTVEKGKTRDLLILDANPLDDIRNTQGIAGVMIGGRFFPKPALDKMLADVSSLSCCTASCSRERATTRLTFGEATSQRSWEGRPIISSV